MPVPGNHPNLCVRRVCSTGLGAERTFPVKYAPQTAYPRTRLEKMYQIQTIKKRLHPIWRCREPLTVSGGLWLARSNAWMRGETKALMQTIS